MSGRGTFGSHSRNKLQQRGSDQRPQAPCVSGCLSICEGSPVSCRALWIGSAAQPPPGAAESTGCAIHRARAAGGAPCEWKSVGCCWSGWQVNDTKRRGNHALLGYQRHVTSQHFPVNISYPLKKNQSIKEIQTLHLWHTQKNRKKKPRERQM